MAKRTLLVALLIGALLMGAFAAGRDADAGWSKDEIAQLQSLWIGNQSPLPADPSNRVADDPRARALGRALFFDTRMSANGQVACATCHLPERQFQDDRARAHGVGDTARRTMPLTGVAHNAWFFWDGRKDSLWSQALGPLESAVEHGIDRTRVMHLVRKHHLASYEAVFGPMPVTGPLPERAGPQSDAAGRGAWNALPESDRVAINTVFANVGKAIAAYERQIRFGPSKFDRYVEAVLHGREPGADGQLSADERAGLKLFIGRAQCTQCHNGPLFSDSHFHNTGVPAVKDLPADTGRASAISIVLADEFNCLGRYSDAKPSQCSELRFMSKDTHQLTRAYKPPTLRNVALRPPYMHAGQYATLEEVLDHYSRAPQSSAGHSELKPLRLSQRERRQLIAFLGTLNGPILVAPESAPQATQLSSVSGSLQ